MSILSKSDPLRATCSAVFYTSSEDKDTATFDICGRDDDADHSESIIKQNRQSY